MANLLDSLYEDYSKLKLTWSSPSASAPATTDVPAPEIGTIIQWINDLHNKIPFISDFALRNLAIHRNKYEILPLLLWKSPCTVAMLLQEVVRNYPQTSPAYSQNGISIRVYKILLLFQCIAHCPETRSELLKAKMPHYFYPLMEIDRTDKPFESLRLGALGVIAHMLKTPVDVAAVRFLMDSGALHYCTKAVEIGSTESKALVVFILNKMLSTDEGLQYCCVLADRFFVIDGLLKKLLVYLSSMAKPSSSMFNLVTGCYCKLSKKARARDAIRRYVPIMLFNGTFASLLAEDPIANSYCQELYRVLT